LQHIWPAIHHRLPGTRAESKGQLLETAKLLDAPQRTLLSRFEAPRLIGQSLLYQPSGFHQ
jgi:hypothetical protein